MAFLDKFKKMFGKKQDAEPGVQAEVPAQEAEGLEPLADLPVDENTSSMPLGHPAGGGSGPVLPLYLEDEPHSEASDHRESLVLPAGAEDALIADESSPETPVAPGSGNGDGLKEETILISETPLPEEPAAEPEPGQTSFLLEPESDPNELREEMPEDIAGEISEALSAQGQAQEPGELPADQPSRVQEPKIPPAAAKNTANITPMSEFLVAPDPAANASEKKRPRGSEVKKSTPGKPKTKMTRPAKVSVGAEVDRSLLPGKPAPAAAAGRKPTAAPVPAARGPRLTKLAAWVPALAGVLVGAGLVLIWYGWGPGRQKMLNQEARAQKEIARLKADLENEKMVQQNVRTGQKRLFELLNDFYKDSSRSPAKPDYFKPARGSLVVFWVDGLIWRQYHVYQAQGPRGAMKRLNETPDKKNFIYIKKLAPGIWRFAVSALNKEGKETPLSEEVSVKMP